VRLAPTTKQTTHHNRRQTKSYLKDNFKSYSDYWRCFFTTAAVRRVFGLMHFVQWPASEESGQLNHWIMGART